MLYLLYQPLMQQLHSSRTSKPFFSFYGKSHLFPSASLYLAVNCSPPDRSKTYQNKSADINHNSACLASRGPCRGVPPVSVPLVNNRKGSLLPPAVPSALRQVGAGVPVVPPRRRPTAAVAAAAAAGEVNRIQRARSLPVKYRYHPGLPSNATLSHQHRKPPAAPTVFGLVAIGLSNKKHVPARPPRLHVKHSLLTTRRAQLSAVKH